MLPHHEVLSHLKYVFTQALKHCRLKQQRLGFLEIVALPVECPSPCSQARTTVHIHEYKYTYTHTHTHTHTCMNACIHTLRFSKVPSGDYIITYGHKLLQIGDSPDLAGINFCSLNNRYFQIFAVMSSHTCKRWA